MGCDAIQVFNQSPRQWRPTRWKDDDIAEFRERDGRRADQVGGDPRRLPDQLRLQGRGDPRRSRSPRWSTPCRWATPSAPTAWCCTPAPPSASPTAASMKRVGKALEKALAESDSLPAAAGGHRRRGQHDRPHVRGARRAGHAGRRRQAAGHLPGLLPPAGLRLRRAHRRRGRGDHGRVRRSTWAAKRLRCLHVNDSKMPLGLQPRPPRPAGHRRAGRPRLRRVPVRAPLREPAGAVRGPGLRGQRGGAGHRADARAAPQRPAAPASAAADDARARRGCRTPGRW